jgi:hypothetical protein
MANEGDFCFLYSMHSLICLSYELSSLFWLFGILIKKCIKSCWDILDERKQISLSPENRNDLNFWIFPYRLLLLLHNKFKKKN